MAVIVKMVPYSTSFSTLSIRKSVSILGIQVLRYLQGEINDLDLALFQEMRIKTHELTQDHCLPFFFFLTIISFTENNQVANLEVPHRQTNLDSKFTFNWSFQNFVDLKKQLTGKRTRNNSTGLWLKYSAHYYRIKKIVTTIIEFKRTCHKPITIKC